MKQLRLTKQNEKDLAAFVAGTLIKPGTAGNEAIRVGLVKMRKRAAKNLSKPTDTK